MNAFLEQLNSKEYAWIFYILVGVFLCMLSKSMRSNLKSLLKSLFNEHFIVIYLVVFSYITLSVLLLKWIGIWDFTLLKDSIFWTFLVAFPLMFKANKIDSFKKFIKMVVIPLFKFSVVFEFVFGLYTFSLWVEMIIIPVVVFIAGIMAVSERKPEHRKVYITFQWILNILILWILYGIGKHLIQHYHEYCNLATVRQFFSPLCLSVLFLPVLYGLSMYLHYETVLVILKRYLKDSGNYHYAVSQAMLRFNGDLEGLLRWKNLMVVRHLQSKKEITDGIALIKTLQKNEKDPHTVSSELGWSPYLAKDFLLSMGIETPPYANTYEDEFMTISSPWKINKNIIQDTVIYSVTGGLLIALELHLELRVFYGNDSLNARLLFMGFVSQLYQSAAEEPMPIKLGKAVEKGRSYNGKTDFTEISLKREVWTNQTNGYSLEFRIIHQSQKNLAQ